MPPEETVVIEAPLVTPETSFEDYVAQRLDAAHKETFAAEVEPDIVAEAPNPTPEVVESAPTEETPAATVTPSEPATAPAIVEETQEQKEQREKNKGIPQSRLDEVTKARREAERALESEKTAREKAERELAELKAKPPETKPAEAIKPVIEPEKPKPVAPDPPTLEGEAGGDWDKFQKLTAEYNKVKYPAYVEELSDWKADQRDIANKKKVDDEAAAKRTEAENKAKAEAQEAEEKAKVTWNSQLQAVKDSHPDYDEKTSKVPASQAMAIAIGDLENGPEFCYWLADRPEEAKRIADLTGFGKTLALPDLRKAVIKAVREFDKLGFESNPTTTPETPVVETPVTPEVVAPVTVPPVNPKPASTKAPRPPSPVNDRGNPGPQDPSKADTFEAYEQSRLAKLKTATRR